MPEILPLYYTPPSGSMSLFGSLRLPTHSWLCMHWPKLRLSNSTRCAPCALEESASIKSSRRSIHPSEHPRRTQRVLFTRYHMHSESQQLRTGDLALLRNFCLDNNRAHRYKLSDKWFGPYHIPENSTHYLLEELDGTELKDSAAGNHLKKFFSRAELDRIRAEWQSTICVHDVRDLDDEEKGNLQREADLTPVSSENYFGKFGKGR
jgi:hypothetical protein